MKNKIVMITGSTSGLGLVSAEVLAQKGAHLILEARNKNKVKLLVERLQKSTGNPNIE